MKFTKLLFLMGCVSVGYINGDQYKYQFDHSDASREKASTTVNAYGYTVFVDNSTNAQKKDIEYIQKNDFFIDGGTTLNIKNSTNSPIRATIANCKGNISTIQDNIKPGEVFTQHNVNPGTVNFNTLIPDGVEQIKGIKTCVATVTLSNPMNSKATTKKIPLIITMDNPKSKQDDYAVVYNDSNMIELATFTPPKGRKGWSSVPYVAQQ